MTVAPPACDHAWLSEFIEPIKVNYLLYMAAPAARMAVKTRTRGGDLAAAPAVAPVRAPCVPAAPRRRPSGG